jgi:hypothetical protein
MRGHDEPALDRRREHGDRLGALEDAGRDRLIGDAHDLFQDDGGVADALGLLGLRLKHGHSPHRTQRESGQDR